MASIDNISVRDEVEKLKEEFDAIQASGSVSPEVKILFNGLFSIINIMLAVFMQKTTKKNSKNSSIPSSQTETDDTATDNRKNSKLGRKSPNQGDFSNSTETTKSRTISVNSCENCAENLAEQPVDSVERRTTIDIVFQKVTRHVDVETKTCPCCQTVNQGKFPKDMPGPLQYGNGVRIFLINLVAVQMVALNRASNMLAAFIGKVLSEATILKYLLQLYVSLERWEREQFEWMLNEAVVHTDETSLKVDRKNHWIHVYSSGDVTIKRLHRKRGNDAIIDINFIPKYGGTIIHDCLASYLSYKHCGHGLCGSHLLRELTFIVEANEYRWATNMKRLLKRVCKIVAKRKSKKLTTQEYIKLQKHYRNILTRGYKEMPEVPLKPKTKRGKMAKSDAHNLWERFKTHEEAILLFAKRSEVPFTNNRAERDLRMSKVKQKVSGCFRTEKYAHVYCRISSYIQNMTAKGYNPMAAIEMAITGEIYLKEV